MLNVPASPDGDARLSVQSVFRPNVLERRSTSNTSEPAEARLPQGSSNCFHRFMVTFFGILVVPLGIVSITLIILQPLAVGAWCTPCLLAAAAMIIMISLTLDEVVAMCQFLVQAMREGQPFWRTFWLGQAPGSAGAR